MRGFIGDVRYALRALRRMPLFTALAVLSLALAIGANTAVFSLLDALLLRRLPVSAPDHLVTLEQVLTDGSRLFNFSLQDAERFAGLTHVFSSVSATTWADGYNVAVGSNLDERLARISVVSGAFFRTIGVGAMVGRTFDESDDRIDGGHPVVVISETYWRRRFQRDPSVIGRTLRVNGTTYDIIGVARRGFSGEWVGWPTDLWIPVAMAGQVFGEHAPGLPRGLRRQYKVLARLTPDASMVAAQSAAAQAYLELQADPPVVSGVSRTARLELVSAATGYSPQRESFARPLRALMVGVNAVLLIACANVANLLLARTSARRREMAIRVAIGASRIQVVRLVMIEAVVIAIGGGALGLLAAAWETSALADLARSGPVGSVNFGARLVDLEVGLDSRTLLFTLALCLITPWLFALAPALTASTRSRAHALAARAADAVDPGGWLAARRLLVIGQIALSLTLIAATGLLVRSLVNLKSQELGFSRARLLLAWTLPSATGRQGTALLAFWTDVQQRIAALPGVVSVSPSSEGLLAAGPIAGPLIRTSEMAPADARRAEATMTIGPDFFGTVDQRVLAGREFAALDTDSSTPVAIVSESLARSLFGASNPVGRRALIGAGDGAEVEIVGVVEDAAHSTPRARHQRTLYYPAAQNVRRLRWMCLAIKTEGDPAAVAAAVRQELRSIDPSLPVLKIDTLSQQLDAALFEDRLITNLAMSFGLLAATLAGAGLCAMLFYAVARRTKEIGIRLALGAPQGAVQRLVLMDTLLMVLLGILIGLPLTLLVSQALVGRLFGVSAHDPITIAMSVAAIGAVSIVAAAAPALRASRTDPLVVLKAD